MQTSDPTPRQKSHNAFTLIELLVVIGIIAILAAIAVPNFLEAQTRSKVARAQSDQRTIALALEAYQTEWNTYPGDFLHGLSAMTTPIAYLSSIPADPYAVSTSASVFSYELGTGRPRFVPETGEDLTFPNTWWMLASAGPDLVDDTERAAAFPETFAACPYDPTNGSVSTGDINRLSRPHPNFVTELNPHQTPDDPL